MTTRGHVIVVKTSSQRQREMRKRKIRKIEEPIIPWHKP